jgi:hypothetical protein
MVEISQKVLWIVLELAFVDEMQVVGERLQGGIKNPSFFWNDGFLSET